MNPKKACPYYLSGRCIHRQPIKALKNADCVYSNALNCPFYENTKSKLKDGQESLKMPKMTIPDNIFQKALRRIKRK